MRASDSRRLLSLTDLEVDAVRHTQNMRPLPLSKCFKHLTCAYNATARDQEISRPGLRTRRIMSLAIPHYSPYRLRHQAGLLQEVERISRHCDVWLLQCIAKVH